MGGRAWEEDDEGEDRDDCGDGAENDGAPAALQHTWFGRIGVKGCERKRRIRVVSFLRPGPGRKPGNELGNGPGTGNCAFVF